MVSRHTGTSLEVGRTQKIESFLTISLRDLCLAIMRESVTKIIVSVSGRTGFASLTVRAAISVRISSLAVHVSQQKSVTKAS